MLSMNLFRGQIVRGCERLQAGCLPLVLLSITSAGLMPSSLHADEPSADGRLPAIAEATPKDTPAEETPAEETIIEDTTVEAAAPTPASATAAPTAAEAGSTDKSTSSSAPMTAKRRGTAARLPAYFGRVVDDQQRTAIYHIRARAEVQLRQLQQQIDSIRQTEQAEMEALLSAEQLQQIEILRAQRAKSAKPPKTAAPQETEAS